jgi:hypothetical protein
MRPDYFNKLSQAKLILLVVDSSSGPNIMNAADILYNTLTHKNYLS